jgi:hypothetical protein
MRSGLFVPIFDALADPALVARLSAEAEEAGWDGIFLWDHVRWRESVLEVSDAWITLGPTLRSRVSPWASSSSAGRPASGNPDGSGREGLGCHQRIGLPVVVHAHCLPPGA